MLLYRYLIKDLHFYTFKNLYFNLQRHLVHRPIKSLQWFNYGSYINGDKFFY